MCKGIEGYYNHLAGFYFIRYNPENLTILEKNFKQKTPYISVEVSKGFWPGWELLRTHISIINLAQFNTVEQKVLFMHNKLCPKDIYLKKSNITIPRY